MPPRRVARHRNLLASCPSRPSLVIFVLWREHMITRRPAHPRRHAGHTGRKIHEPPEPQPGRLNDKVRPNSLRKLRGGSARASAVTGGGLRRTRRPVVPLGVPHGGSTYYRTADGSETLRLAHLLCDRTLVDLALSDLVPWCCTLSLLAHDRAWTIAFVMILAVSTWWLRRGIEPVASSCRTKGSAVQMDGGAISPGYLRRPQVSHGPSCACES
jgi:hypothetical protein